MFFFLHSIPPQKSLNGEIVLLQCCIPLGFIFTATCFTFNVLYPSIWQLQLWNGCLFSITLMSDLRPTVMVPRGFFFIPGWFHQYPAVSYSECRQKRSQKSRHFRAKHVLIGLHLEDITELQWKEWRLQLARHTLWLRLMGFFFMTREINGSPVPEQMCDLSCRESAAVM